MNYFHTMNTQRITISIPGYLYRRLVTSVAPRGVSNFVARALEEKLLVSPKQTDLIGYFFALKTKLPQKDKKEILEAIKKGRT